MQLSFECPSCGKSYDFPWALAGKRVRCSQCSNDFVVPVPFEPRPPKSSEAIPVVNPPEEPPPPPPPRPRPSPVPRTMKIEVPPPPPLEPQPEPEHLERARRANRKGGALTPELLERLRTGSVVRPGDPPEPPRRPREEPSRSRAEPAPRPSRPAPAYAPPEPVFFEPASTPRPPWLIPAIVGGGIALVLTVNIAFYLAFLGNRVVADRSEPAESSVPEIPAEVPEGGSPAPPVVEESTEKVKVVEAEVVPDPPMKPDEIVASFEPSVALIKGKKGSGTGFIARAGIVATNSHVIVNERITDVEVSFPSAEKSKQGPYPAKLIYQDRERDLALLEVATDLPPVRVAEAYKFRKGEDVTVIGNPGVGDRMILENAVSRGIVSSMTTLKSATSPKRHSFLQLGIAINPGNSGGPVFDHKGRVIGVVTLKTIKQEGLAFAIPADDLRAALDLVPTTAAPDSPSGKTPGDRTDRRR